MIFPRLLLLACSILSDASPSGEGSIRGIVVNGTQGRAPAAGAEVVLRVKIDGQFVIAAESIADAWGEFRFEPLPVDQDFQYLPGANRQGVHYPGKRIRLTPERPHVAVELVVYDAARDPNPLIARRHEIIVCPEPGALKVTETILVDNPTATCYVGQAPSPGEEPVTLRLAVPSDFERITFHQEFFGRRFSLVDGKLVTGIPWPPGEKELKLTYLLRNQQRCRLWERPLDLPCSYVRLCVLTDKPEEVSCNLPPGPSERRGERVFESGARALPAGHVVGLELGRLPVPWIIYGRYLALIALVGLIAGTSLAMIRRGGRKEGPTHRPASGPTARRESASRPRARRTRRGRKQTASVHRRG